jgi:hypothetical protein
LNQASAEEIAARRLIFTKFQDYRARRLAEQSKLAALYARLRPGWWLHNMLLVSRYQFI